ncbi:MAG: DUF4922 domain-containing protein [Paludibacter sp.]
MNKLNAEVKVLFAQQIANWELARTNYEGLKTVKTKSISFGDFDVKVQFNPARIVSSGAKVDAKTISERKCFLCLENLPAEQKGIDAGDYTVLVNPFPIFPEHFTIPHKQHIDQQILLYFADMLVLAEALDDYLVFYNGPKCGASAPDHLHFQAGTKDFLPLVNDFKRLKETHAQLLVESETFQLFSFNEYQRTVYCIESINKESAINAFEKLYSHFQTEENVEPMMNVVCTFEEDKWLTFVLPRAHFRPWQYTAEGQAQLLVSPATVEMCGIFITPIESHFERITKEDVVSILEQSSKV